MVMAKHKRIMANGKITRAIKPCEAKISADLDTTRTLLVQRWKSIKENKEVRRKKESTLSTKKTTRKNESLDLKISINFTFNHLKQSFVDTTKSNLSKK